MTSQPNAVRDLQEECDRLRSQALDQEERIAAMSRQIEQLRLDTVRLAAERDTYWKLSGRILADEIARHEEAYETEGADLINHHSDELGDLIRELEGTVSGGETPDAR